MQDLLGAHQHSCFHCTVPEHERTMMEAVDASERPSWQDRRKVAERAMFTGQYGTDEQWKRLISAPKPIMRLDERNGSEYLVPESIARYKDCSRVTGVRPDPNPLWDLPVNLNQLMRDDELHQMRLGMFVHVLAAAMSKYTEVLHPDWAKGTGAWPGVAGMKAVWARLTARLARAGTTMTPYVSQSVGRGFASRQYGRKSFQFGLTGHETEQLFVQVPACPVQARPRALCVCVVWLRCVA